MQTHAYPSLTKFQKQGSFQVKQLSRKLDIANFTSVKRKYFTKQVKKQIFTWKTNHHLLKPSGKKFTLSHEFSISHNILKVVETIMLRLSMFMR